MKKIFGLIIGSFVGLGEVFSAEKFDIIPDLPEPLASAQASSITTGASNADNVIRSVGSEPNILTLISSLIIVILFIFLCAKFYTWLKKVGFKVVGQQAGSIDSTRVTVVSTTPLGSNKTLHVVELDGKRMLIGASANSIDLIKDLGSYPPVDAEECEYSKIEIPNIRIPKIEIPKIEFPDIGFTKAFKTKSVEEDRSDDQVQEVKADENNNSEKFVISDIYEESPDGIIDKLFTSVPAVATEEIPTENKEEDNHTINPDEYALYKKYL